MTTLTHYNPSRNLCSKCRMLTSRRSPATQTSTGQIEIRILARGILTIALLHTIAIRNATRKSSSRMMSGAVLLSAARMFIGRINSRSKMCGPLQARLRGSQSCIPAPTSVVKDLSNARQTWNAMPKNTRERLCGVLFWAVARGSIARTSLMSMREGMWAIDICPVVYRGVLL